jgi:enolase-phosphatase E1
MAPGPAAIVLDIEGTTTPIAFVHEVLFPFARARLPALLRDRAADPAVAVELAAVRDAEPGQDPLAVLLGWMDADVQATPLKQLQGLLWREGYADGTLQGALYPDVAPALRAWRAEGRRLFVYSSGSIEAQRLIFAHSSAGDLSALFDGYFDTRTGPKREASSYAAIAAAAGLVPQAMLFLSDVAAELDAARTAGLLTCQLVRERDGTIASGRHPAAAQFPGVTGAVPGWVSSGWVSSGWVS